MRGRTSIGTFWLWAVAIFCLLPISGLLAKSGFWQAQEAAAQGCPDVAATPWYTMAYGTVLIDGVDAPVGTVVEAVSPRGDVVGCQEVKDPYPGQYPALFIYREDASANPPIPGMREGETVLFRVAGYGATATPNLIFRADRELYEINLTAESPLPLDPPSNLSASAVSQTQINLAWTDNSADESSFRVERSPDGVSGWTEIGYTGANATAYSDTNLTCGTAHHYRVSAYRQSDDLYSDPSNAADATTHACPLDPPSNLNATPVSQTQINLSWADNSNDESSFRVERSPDGVSGWTEIGYAGANSTAHSDTNLTCGTAYHYRVSAYRQSDDLYSDPSNVADAMTDACPLDPPSSLNATMISQSQISLSWQDNSSDESAFHIERSEDGGVTWVEIQAVGAGVSAHVDTGLTCNSAYHYRVRAYRDSDGQYSTYSNIDSATTGACDGPNVLLNPGFEEGKSSWSFYTNGGGSFSATTPAYNGSAAARLSFTSTGSNMQLFQNNVPLKPFTDYTLSFYAYSNTGHDLSVALLKQSSPYTNYGLSSDPLNLSTAWQHFSIDFSTSGFATNVNDGRLRFWFAGMAIANDTYHIDDVDGEVLPGGGEVEGVGGEAIVGVG